MKKILILAYDFPPYVSVGGLRPYAWFEYFHEFGFEPVVVTRQWSNEYRNELDYIAPSSSKETIVEKTAAGRVYRTAYTPNLANQLYLTYGKSKYSTIRKLITAFYELTQFFYLTGPKKLLYQEADKLFKIEKFDVIIATGDPFVLHHYASKLSSKHQLPWIADYRDPWSENIEMGKRPLLKIWHKWIEKKTVQTASLITTVSSFLFSQIYGLKNNQPCLLLPNGYNPSSIEGIDFSIQEKKELRIALAGSILEWHPIESYLEEFRNFIQTHPYVMVKTIFYGINKEDEVKVFLNKNWTSWQKYVEFIPKMENKKLMKELANCHLFLLFNYYSYMGTKIYDYLALKRPILFCYTDDKEALELKNKYFLVPLKNDYSQRLQEDLLRESGVGIIIKDKAHLSSSFLSIYQQWEKGELQPVSDVNHLKYSRKYQTSILASTIKRILEKN